MSETAHVAAVQLNSRLGEPDTNLDKAESLLAGLEGEVDIACLPELANTGYNLDFLGGRLLDLAEPVPDGKTTRRLADMARRFKLAIIAGLVERDPEVTGVIYDSVVLLDRKGEYVGCYRKSHLYPDEYRFFTPGNSIPVFCLGGLKVGIAICFEHAFPQVFSTLALRGAQIVFNPSAVPVGFGYLQDLRTRARAQDNQFFVMAVNHVGQEDGVTYCGQSQIADPRGQVIALAEQDCEQTVVSRLDLSLIRDQRVQEPILRSFRPELYQFKPGSAPY